MKEYTIEEINAYRAEVYRILIEMGETEDFAEYVSCRGKYSVPSEDLPGIWKYVMWQSPKDYAELMTM